MALHDALQQGDLLGGGQALGLEGKQAHAASQEAVYTEQDRVRELCAMEVEVVEQCLGVVALRSL